MPSSAVQVLPSATSLVRYLQHRRDRWLVRPLQILGNTVRLEWPVMMLAALQMFLLARDGEVDRIEGGVLVVALVVFIAYAVRLARTAATTEEKAEFEQLTD